jgi:uncharacterized protein (TIGR03067 family)
MSRHLLIAFGVFALSAALAKSEPPVRPNGWKQLAGTWKPKSREMNGKKEMAPKDIVDCLELVITGNKVVVKEDGEPFKATISVKITPEKSPAWVDFFVTLEGEKPDPTQGNLGIYKVVGDTLTICYHPPGKDTKRPTQFATRDGDSAILLVLKKKKR